QRIDGSIEAALDAADRAAAGDRSRLSQASLAKFWFWLDADGAIREPATTLGAISSIDRASDRNAPVGRVDDYLRELSRRQDRAAKLRAAQRTEACGTEACMAEARRQYAALVGFDDTGPEALLGLGRVQLRLGDAHASATLDELDRRFGDRSFPEGGGASERVPVKLVTALMRAEAAHDRPAALLDVADAVLAGKLAVAPVVGVGVATRIRGELAADPAAASRIASLDGELAAIRETARAAAGLAPDADAMVHAATVSWRGQPASHQSGRTLIYKRRADTTVIGIAVDSAMLADVAGADAAAGVSPHARAIVLPVGTQPPAQDRVLSQIAFGERLPHLALALVDPIGEPDPLDEVIRARSRRHVILTSGLVLLLGVGLLATIRGAVRARELAQLKSDFVSTVSHELKTPLTSIRMFAEMLEQGVAHGDADKMHRYHGVIVQESQRLGLLIANLLDYAQIERGTRRYSPSSVAIDRLARDAVATFEALRDPDRGGRNPIEVEVSPGAMAVELEIDRDVVVQAVLNLLANAAKYGGADQPIEVRVDADAASASIAVRDHGPGIPAHEQARIFREFYRTPDAYRSNVEGTGLGLALVKRHIEALGGSVDVSSTLGEGAAFTIRLPREVHA
ncbi:MAG TPA: HAMP domain-containing sensor histidine kinase, partial [Kofleriaceae bacterium]|nr:HAMP domain-containing sensor histidine kinase [Kofleriaceae bacterium]